MHHVYRAAEFRLAQKLSFNVIFLPPGAIMQHVGDQVKEQDMETAMGDHLKYAPDRPGGGRRK